jgi:hypothetical protein
LLNRHRESGGWVQLPDSPYMSEYIVPIIFVLMLPLLLVILVAGYIGLATSSVALVTIYFLVVGVISFIISRKTDSRYVFAVSVVSFFLWFICLTNLFGLRTDLLGSMSTMFGYGKTITWHF